MELSPFIAICGWAGNDFDVDIHVTTTDFTKQVMNTFKIPVVINTLIADVNVQEYNALAILNGFEEYCIEALANHDPETNPHVITLPYS